jgi:threonine synthase
MKYQSTRGDPNLKSFTEILLEGLALDGGLFLPVDYPQIDLQELDRLRDVWKTQGYASLAFELIKKFVDDIPYDDLKAICQEAYQAKVFQDERITPVRSLERGLFILGLSNGPTCAFKDIAMQLLGHLFEYELTRKDQFLNVLGATSGDTGSAAEYAMRGKSRIQVFMTSPKGRMSAYQQAQMFTLQDKNIHNLCIEGVFDDCQDIVKAVSNDLDFKKAHRIGTVNSINWARLLAQVVYYFSGYFQVTNQNGEPVDFCVPSGNFGNVCAGHVARSMGLPIRRLIVATNENDVLDEFFRSGVYQVRDSVHTYETSSPSMDISKASNFERFIFDVLGRSAQETKNLFSNALSKENRFDLSHRAEFLSIALKFGFHSGSSSHANRLETIRRAHREWGSLIDPHTADGLKVALEYRDKSVAMVVLETALPIKFSETIKEALDLTPPTTEEMTRLLTLPRRFTVMPSDVSLVKRFIADHSHFPAIQ